MLQVLVLVLSCESSRNHSLTVAARKSLLSRARKQALLYANFCKLVLVLFTAPTLLSATSITWAGGTDNWSNVNDWICSICSGPTYPNNGNLGNNYQVSISGTSLVTLDVSPVVNSVSLSSGAALDAYNGASLTSSGAYTQVASSTSLDGNATTLQAGSFTQDASSSLHMTNTAAFKVSGDFASAGATNLQSGSVLTAGGVLNNTGNLYIVDGNTAVRVTGSLTNTSASLSLYNGANLQAAAFTQTGTPTILDGVGTSMQLASFTQDSASSLHSTNQAVTTVTGAFTNNGGSVNFQSGSQLTIGGNLANSGSLYLVDGNTSLSAANDSNTNASVSLYNSAQFKVNGNYAQTGSATLLDGIGTSLQADSFTQDATSGLHSTNTAITTVSSSFANSGTINLQSGSVLNIGGSLTNSPGAFVFLTDGNTTLQADANFTNDQSSVILNDASSVVVTGDYTQTNSSTNLDGIGTFLQAGTLVQDSESVLTMTNQARTIVTGMITNNGGTINVASGSSIQGAGLTNDGAISILGGNSSIVLSGGLVDNGQLSNDGTISAQTLTVNSGGMISGFGTISAYLINNGQDRPGDPAVQTISGGYSQGPNGILSLDLAGLSSYDQLAVSGNVTLGGELAINLIDGYLPDLNDLFTILSVSNGSLSGNFASYVFPVWNDLTFQEIVESNAIELKVVNVPVDSTPEPSTFALLVIASLGAAWVTLSNRLKGGCSHD